MHNWLPNNSKGDRNSRSRLAKLALLGAVGLFLASIWIASLRYFVSEEIQSAEARLSLYRSTVVAEVERFEHLTKVLSVDPFVVAGLETGATSILNARLESFSEASGLDAIFLMDREGGTIAASNAGRPGSFIGQNYAFRPYFQKALQGSTGTFYGIGATTGLPGYFIADPVYGHDSDVIGVVAIKIGLVPFERSWREAGEQVLLANGHGVVLLASNPAWRYRTLAPLSEAERSQISESRQFAGHDLEALDWTLADDFRVRVDGEDRLHLVSSALPHGWRIHYLASSAPAVTRALLATGMVVVAVVLGLLFMQYMRGRRLGAALRRSEQEEEALRHANAALAQEIEDRRRAERRLEETREELARTSRLAALGQLSASVTHELGQPIAAMRNHLAAAEMTGKGPDSIGTIADLVDRMAGITKQLKFFARSGEDGFETVDLRECLDAVLELMASNISAANVCLDCVTPREPLLVRGARLRIEQVLTNLLRNALDATEEEAVPTVVITCGKDCDNVWVEISDNGHGLGQATLNELREPFVTTRASGRGMGLGLAISSTILNDHGGKLEATNRHAGGALFRMTLPRLGVVDETEERAAE